MKRPPSLWVVEQRDGHGAWYPTFLVCASREGALREARFRAADMLFGNVSFRVARYERVERKKGKR